MDNNKKDKLKEIGYTIQNTCGICVHSNINANWGTCNLHTYYHLKHTESKRHLSIYRGGSCNSFERDIDEVKVIHGFADLLGDK